MDDNENRMLQMRRISTWKLARVVTAVAAASMGLVIGRGGLIAYNQAESKPEVANVNELTYAADQLASYSGSNPEAALLQTKELVQKNDAENKFYQEGYDKIYGSIDHLIGLGIKNITQPEFYGAQLENVAKNIRDVADNRAVKEMMYNSAEALLMYGAFVTVSYGGMTAVSSYMIKKEQAKLDAMPVYR
jgi:hypothetical protein